MKTIPLVLLTIMVVSPSVRSQDEEQAVPQKGAALPATFIPSPLEVPLFTPPEPVPPKVLTAVCVDAAVTVPASNSRTLTILRGEASTLPDIPPPPVIESAEPRELTADDIERMKWERRHSLNLGATVYDHKVSQVQWTDPETLESYQAICGYDIGLLSGVGGFVHNGENFQLFLMHSDINTTAIRRVARARDFEIPEIPAGEICITHGNPDDAEAIALLTVIKEIIDVEKKRLEAYQAAREIYFSASAAWFAAHPPIPKNETFLLRPHRGSRYLANPQPEKQGAAR